MKLWRRDGTLMITISASDKAGIGINEVAFSPDGQIIASASQDGNVKLWSRDGTLMTTIPASDKESIHGVAFSSDGQIIASAGQDGDVKLWRRNGTRITLDKTIFASEFEFRDSEVKYKDGDYMPSVYSVDFSPDGKIIASSNYSGLVKLWQRDGKLIRSFQTSEGAPTFDIHFSPNGQMIVSANGGNYGDIKLSLPENGSLIGTFDSSSGLEGEVRRVAVSPDGQTIAIAGGKERVVMWNLNMDDLLVQGCEKVRYYLKKTNAKLSEEDKDLCDGI